jgi:alkylation response protein AidB-like acyl-CoA dehydrogenase
MSHTSSSHLPGISRGKPLDKIGQRALPQGEIYFDNVKMPKRSAIALKDEYLSNLASMWSYAGTHMSSSSAATPPRASLAKRSRARSSMMAQKCGRRS